MGNHLAVSRPDNPEFSGLCRQGNRRRRTVAVTSLELRGSNPSMKANLALCLALLGVAHPAGAEPSSTPPADQGPEVTTLLLDPRDASRDRIIPLKVYRAKDASEPRPVILFSHGLGGSREGNPYLGNHWARNGYVAVFLQHIGTDRSVWENAAPRDRMAALKAATGIQGARDRFDDVPFVIDQLEAWNAEEGHPLHGTLDLEHIGMAGHSYGAVTTLAMTDRTFLGNRTLHQKRIDAFVPMSPQPGKGGKPDDHFGSVSVPVLCMTGTEDGSPVDPNLRPADRRKVYEAFPSGDKYQLVFDGAEHHAFGEGGSARKERSRFAHHHPAIQELSTRFFDAYLKGDEAARSWLQSEAPRQACSLAEKDVWEWK